MLIKQLLQCAALAAGLALNTGLARSEIHVAVSNLTKDGLGAHGLADASGNLLPDNVTGNVRFGFSTMSDSEIVAAWQAGNLAALNASFTQLGTSFGMSDYGGPSGLFEKAFDFYLNIDQFYGQNYLVWASNGSDFTNTGGQYLIYRYDAVFEDNNLTLPAYLGTDPGRLLVGGYDNWEFDYGYGLGLQEMFNLSALPIPEPAAMAMLVTGMVALWLVRRRR